MRYLNMIRAVVAMTVIFTLAAVLFGLLRAGVG